MNTNVPIPLTCNSVTISPSCDLNKLLSIRVELALKYVLRELLYIRLLLRYYDVITKGALEQYLVTRGLRVILVVNNDLGCVRVGD